MAKNGIKKVGFKQLLNRQLQACPTLNVSHHVMHHVPRHVTNLLCIYYIIYNKLFN